MVRIKSSINFNLNNKMNSFGLIIQGTTAGFNDLYVSENLMEIRQTDEIQQTAVDEREFSTKLSNQSNVYTVQLTSDFRVYSLVDTNVTDFVGGAGFYAIRLYAPKKYPLQDFQTVLQSIYQKFLLYESDGTAKINQEYESILAYQLPLEIKQLDFIHSKSSGEAYCFYNPAEMKLSNIFNSNYIALFKKVYAFNQDVAVSAEIMMSLGLISLNDNKQDIKEVLIDNSDRVLKELKINNIPIGFKSSETEIQVLAKEGDVLEFNTTDSPKFIQGRGLLITVSKKIIPPPRPPRNPKKPDFFKQYGVYIIMFLMVGIIGYVGWQFVFPEQIIQEQPIVIQPTKQESVTNQLEIKFELDGTENEINIYKTNYPKLEKYRFKVENKKWIFKNIKGNDKYVNFFKSTVEDIIIKDSLDFSPNQKEQFITNLQNIAKVEIGNKPEKNDEKKEDAKVKTSKEKERSKDGDKKQSLKIPSAIKDVEKETVNKPKKIG